MSCFFLGWRTAAAIALVGLTAVACGADRPAVETWQDSWDRISSGIPDASLLTEPTTMEGVCAETLAFLRSNRADLTPTPDLAIDDVVTQWIEVAEDAFFECPPRNAQISDFAEAYAEMSRLEAEVELVLDIDRSG